MSSSAGSNDPQYGWGVIPLYLSDFICFILAFYLNILNRSYLLYTDRTSDSAFVGLWMFNAIFPPLFLSSFFGYAFEMYPSKALRGLRNLIMVHNAVYATILANLIRDFLAVASVKDPEAMPEMVNIVILMALYKLMSPFCLLWLPVLISPDCTYPISDKLRCVCRHCAW